MDFGFSSGPITLPKLDFLIYLGFENKKQNCLMLSSNLCGIAAQHDDLDQIEHLSNFDQQLSFGSFMCSHRENGASKAKKTIRGFGVGQKFVIRKPFVIFVNFSWKVERFFWCLACD